MMVTTNGSLYLWNTRPAKIIQPLAPFFTEIDENLEYVEKEDEFESETPEEDMEYISLPEDEKKKRKLARKELDIETVEPYHLRSYAQINGLKLRQEN